MALCFKKGAAFAALFSTFTVFAQVPEYLLQPTPKNRPYEPPAWFARLAGQPRQYLNDLPVDIALPFQPMGKPHKTIQKKGCLIHDEQGNKQWGFCDL